MNKLILILGLALSGFISTPEHLFAAEDSIVVIVNQDNDTKKMSAREVRKLFLGKSRKLPDGSRAVLVSNEAILSEFNRSALRKADSQVKAAWSRLLFSGRAKPPVAFSNPADVVQYVAQNANAIGYVLTSQLAEGVKAVHRLK